MFTTYNVNDSGVVGHCSSPSSRSRATRIGPALFLPTDAREVLVHHHYMVTERRELDHRANPTWYIKVDGQDVISTLYPKITGSLNLQTLCLILDAPNYLLKAPERVPTEVKFSQLDRLVVPNLRKVKFTVEYGESFLNRQDHIRALESLHNRHQEGLKEFGD